MNSREKVPLDRVLNLLGTEQALLQSQRRRQAAVWRGEKLDYLPLLLAGGSIPERKNFPSYNLKEQFFTKEKMLYEQVWAVLSTVRAGGDALPSLRANLGTGFLASVFGLEEEVFEDKMPWLKKHLRKDEIKKPSTREFKPNFREGLDTKSKRVYEFF